MEKFWYAIYVKSRHEKSVHELLSRDGIDNYLPLVKILKQWSDRKKMVEQALFPSYLFVHIDKCDYQKVLESESVVKFISFEKKAVIIPDEQINAIRYYLSDQKTQQATNKKFNVGERVEVVIGSLKGLKGEIVEVNGKNKVKVAIEAISQSLKLTLPDQELKKIK